MKMPGCVELIEASRFYGDVLGVNRVSLRLTAGITGLVGPNGAGKSTLMNLITGLLRPTSGQVSVLGLRPDDPEAFFKVVGYCAQYDAFPRGVSGREFLQNTLALHGFPRSESRARAASALKQVGLDGTPADRSVDAYSKGMRQRIRLAQAMCHEPKVLVLDEPLNGLDPVARAQVIELFRQLADAGAIVLISSHILHEVDLISDRVVLLNGGYVVAEGDVAGIQGESQESQHLYIRCSDARAVARRIFSLAHVAEISMHTDGEGLFLRTTDADAFYLSFNRLVLQEGWQVESIGPADETIESVYQQLVVREHGL